jgi:multidrug resistance efflux pump
LLSGLIFGIGLAAARYGYRWWTVGRFVESTDDAYVGGEVTVVAHNRPSPIATWLSSNLGFTELRPPIDGTAGNRSVRPEQMPGSAPQLISLVPASGANPGGTSAPE